MARSYSSGLIGLDVKEPRRGKSRRNIVTRKPTARRWLVPVIMIVGTAGMIVLATLR